VFVHALVFVPVEALVMFGLLWWYIGLPTLFGYAVLILLVPIQFIFSRQFSRYRKGTMECTDKRVQTINELVSGYQILKMYNWEKAMEQRVREARRHLQSELFESSQYCSLLRNVTFGFSCYIWW
jgi:ABC-type bacteriocin/lantibiotic exporter with double-glycine peptidase domain